MLTFRFTLIGILIGGADDMLLYHFGIANGRIFVLLFMIFSIIVFIYKYRRKTSS